jgi:hypothetical protein
MIFSTFIGHRQRVFFACKPGPLYHGLLQHHTPAFGGISTFCCISMMLLSISLFKITLSPTTATILSATTGLAGCFEQVNLKEIQNLK